MKTYTQNYKLNKLRSHCTFNRTRLGQNAERSRTNALPEACVSDRVKTHTNEEKKIMKKLTFAIYIYIVILLTI